MNDETKQSRDCKIFVTNQANVIAKMPHFYSKMNMNKNYINLLNALMTL